MKGRMNLFAIAALIGVLVGGSLLVGCGNKSEDTTGTDSTGAKSGAMKGGDKTGTDDKTGGDKTGGDKTNDAK